MKLKWLFLFFKKEVSSHVEKRSPPIPASTTLYTGRQQ